MELDLRKYKKMRVNLKKNMQIIGDAGCRVKFGEILSSSNFFGAWGIWGCKPQLGLGCGARRSEVWEGCFRKEQDGALM